MKKESLIGSCAALFACSALLAFGMYHVHFTAGITEGGVLGLELLIHHWFGISPALSSAIMNGGCYLLGWRTLGKKFLLYSGVSIVGYSLTFWICEQFSPIYPQIAELPLLAALIGSIFVGVSCGVCVRIGGAPGGDDAFAMSIAKITGISIQWIYLLTDFVVLGLSLSYIPPRKIAYSLLSVVLSGQIIGLLQKRNPVS